VITRRCDVSDEVEGEIKQALQLHASSARLVARTAETHTERAKVISKEIDAIYNTRVTQAADDALDLLDRRVREANGK
jgi:hypothetical protein